MNDRPFDITDTQLDRLVDGELSDSQRRELLVAMESHPDQWRRCALAFLEAQAWRREMEAFVTSADGEAPLTRTGDESRPSRSDWRVAGHWMAVAASLLVAFMVGRQWRAADVPLGGAGQIATVPPQQAPLPDSPATGDIVTLVASDPQGVPQRIRVPLVEARDLGHEFAERPQWSSSPELVRRLDERGLGLVARRRYVPMYFEQQDQRIPMVVPVDDAVIRPVSRPVY